MKKIIVVLLVLSLCLCAAGCAKREYASPGRADGSQPVKEESGNFLTRLFGGSSSTTNSGSSGSSDASQSGGDSQSGGSSDSADNSADTSDSSGSSGSGSAGGSGSSGSSGSPASPGMSVGADTALPAVDNSTPAPASVNSYEYETEGETVHIYYADSMTVSEQNGMAVFTSGNNILYVDYVGDEFDPVRDNASVFLYDYGFSNIAQLVQERYGEISDYQVIEAAVDSSSGELSRFEGTLMGGSTYLYLKAALKTTDNGTDCVVQAAVCEASSATVFDNIEIH